MKIPEWLKAPLEGPNMIQAFSTKAIGGSYLVHINVSKEGSKTADLILSDYYSNRTLLLRIKLADIADYEPVMQQIENTVRNRIRFSFNRDIIDYYLLYERSSIEAQVDFEAQRQVWEKGSSGVLRTEAFGGAYEIATYYDDYGPVLELVLNINRDDIHLDTQHYEFHDPKDYTASLNLLKSVAAKHSFDTKKQIIHALIKEQLL